MVLSRSAVIVLFFAAFVVSAAWITLGNKKWTFADEPLWARAAYLTLLIVGFGAATASLLWQEP